MSASAFIDRFLPAAPRPPSSRAIVGGLLVSLAALGSWALNSPGPHRPASSVIVAARPVPAGKVLSAADLDSQPLDLARSQRARVARSERDIVGSVARVRIERSEIIQRSMIGASTRTRAARQLSFSVDRAWAVGGSLAPGDSVDVLVTYGDGMGSLTRAVLDHVRIDRIGEVDTGGVGAVDTLIVTISINDPTDVLAAANAVRAGSVTLVRSTGVSGSAVVGTFRAGSRDDD